MTADRLSRPLKLNNPPDRRQDMVAAGPTAASQGTPLPPPNAWRLPLCRIPMRPARSYNRPSECPKGRVGRVISGVQHP